MFISHRKDKANRGFLQYLKFLEAGKCSVEIAKFIEIVSIFSFGL